MIFDIITRFLIFSLSFNTVIFAVNGDENINFLSFERNENTGGSLTLAGEHALENGILQLSKRNKKDLPIFDSILSPDFYENENNQHPFDDDINECGGLYKNYSTLITTPNFGIKNYDAGLNCEYIIFSPYRCPNEFHIQFLNFQLEYSENCTKDYLEIGDEKPICGQIIGIQNYKTEDGVLVINFRSDGTIDDKGFKLLITRQPCKEDYIVRKLRQNASNSFNDGRKNKSLNVKSIANHLLPPLKTIENSSFNIEYSEGKQNGNLHIDSSLYNNNYRNSETETNNNFKPYTPGLIPINNNDGYLPPINTNYPNYNNNIPIPNNNPLRPPVGNSNEYLPPRTPAQIYPSNDPEIYPPNNYLPVKPTRPTYILGTDNVIADFPIYPNCQSIPKEFYPITPTILPPQSLLPPNFIQHNSPPFFNYHSQTKLLNIPNLSPQVPITPHNPNYFGNNNQRNIPIENTNNGNIPYPFNVSSVFYPQGTSSLPSKIPSNPSVQYHLQPQILGIIPPATLPPCCANIFQEKHFYISSPGFPYSSNFLTDCLYYIRRTSPNICRLRIRFKFYFLGNPTKVNGIQNIQVETCTDDFIEIDGQRLCGCRTNVEYISQWGLNDKIIRLKLSGRPGNNQGNGFILDIIQEECPNRLQRNVDEVEQLTSLTKRNDVFDTIKSDELNKSVNEKNTTTQTRSLLEHFKQSGHKIKRQASFIRSTEGPSSQFFVFENKRNQCIFTPNDFFNLLIEFLWIRKPQCIPVGQAILRV